LEILDKHGLEFNESWFQSKLDNNYRVYDFGSFGKPVGSYYNLELNMLQIQNYSNLSTGGYLYNNNGIRIIYYGN